jgi:hypothetical protein
MKTATSQIDYLQLNNITLASHAWHGYKASGRGYIHVTSDPQQDLKDALFMFLPEIEISKYADGKGKEAVSKMVSEYDPHTEIVIVIWEGNTTKIRSYTIETTPAPPHAWEEILKSAAALRCCPKISKTVDALESCFKEVMKKPGANITPRGVLRMVVANTLSGMKELYGRSQSTTIPYEKPDGSLSTRTVPVLHEGYAMDGGRKMWNLYNLHLRPLDEPQPESVALAEDRENWEALSAAASISWAFEQSRARWLKGRPKDVRVDYFQAYEMVRKIAALAHLDDNEAAVEALASIAHCAAEELEKLPQRIVRSVARRHPSWPVMVSARMTAESQRAADLAAYLKELDVGAACPLKSTPSSRRDEKVATTHHAVRLFAIVEYNRALGPSIAPAIKHQQMIPARLPVAAPIPEWVVCATKLPPFSRASAVEWWDVARVALDEACAKLEVHPDFDGIAVYVTAIGDGNDIKKKKAKPSVRRTRIIDSIRSAFIKLAPK